MNTAGQVERMVAMDHDPFVAHRDLLFTIAYEMLGASADAEDVVQDTWLSWSRIDQDTIREPRAYLVRMVTRQALDRLRVLKRRRETYIGQWLPEPLLTRPDVAEDIILAENISIAMLTVLETLNPVERAVFVLREVFDLPHDEIAAIIDKTPAATRQIAHRAREHVAARRPRMSVNQDEHQAAVTSFYSAIQSGDLQALLDTLDADVVYVGDGGGVARTALRPVHGADRVARLLLGVVAMAPDARFEPTTVNGQQGLEVTIDNHLDTAVGLNVNNGKISHIYVMRNPEKLSMLSLATRLSRTA